ncbi:uncharacterized protein [Argopecten irradians]|uniref:uncharacterized protein n=1 Tax=Argopecten irradians TaxID=31199 RepID=UPI003710A763
MADPQRLTLVNTISGGNDSTISGHIPPIAGNVSNNGAASLPTVITCDSLTTQATITNVDNRHFDGLLPASSSSSINYANDRTPRDLASFTANSRDNTGSIMAAPVQQNNTGLTDDFRQQLLAQNQSMLMILSQLTKNQTAIHSETPTTPCTNNIDNFSDLLSNDDSVDDHRSLHEVSSDEEDTDFDTHDFLKDLDQQFSKDNTFSPKVHDGLAKIVNDGFKRQLDHKQRKEIFQKHLCPENCNSLVVPKINNNVLNTLKSSHRNRDSGLRLTQTYICGAMYPLIHLTNILTQGSKGLPPTAVKDCLSLAHDTFRLLQVGFSDVTYRRRQALKPILHPDFKALCDSTEPPTQWLLGDDLENKIKELSDAQRISKKLEKPKSLSSNRYSPYQTYNSGNRGGGYQSTSSTRGGRHYQGQHQRHNSNTHRGRGNHHKPSHFLGDRQKQKKKE